MYQVTTIPNDTDRRTYLVMEGAKAVAFVTITPDRNARSGFFADIQLYDKALRDVVARPFANPIRKAFWKAMDDASGGRWPRNEYDRGWWDRSAPVHLLESSE